MNPFTHPLTVTAALACLSLGACRETPQEEPASDPAAATAPTHEEPASPAQATGLPQEIAELQRDIETREQTIEDLNAAVVMEQAKLDENPDYDTSFLQEVLSEQQQERQKIEKAQWQIESLKGCRGK